MALRLKGTYCIPAYALSYIVNADDSGLSDEDLKTIDDFLTKEDLVGCIAQIDNFSYNEFNSRPAFGLACDTYEVEFYE